MKYLKTIHMHGKRGNRRSGIQREVDRGDLSGFAFYLVENGVSRGTVEAVAGRCLSGGTFAELDDKYARYSEFSTSELR